MEGAEVSDNNIPAITREPCLYRRIGDELRLVLEDGTPMVLHPREWSCDLRERAAIAAMQGLYTGLESQQLICDWLQKQDERKTTENIARLAVMQADALIKELNK